jgi:hypothetical protein
MIRDKFQKVLQALIPLPWPLTSRTHRLYSAELFSGHKHKVKYICPIFLDILVGLWNLQFKGSLIIRFKLVRTKCVLLFLCKREHPTVFPCNGKVVILEFFRTSHNSSLVGLQVSIGNTFFLLTSSVTMRVFLPLLILLTRVLAGGRIVKNIVTLFNSLKLL